MVIAPSRGRQQDPVSWTQWNPHPTPIGSRIRLEAVPRESVCTELLGHAHRNA